MRDTSWDEAFGEFITFDIWKKENGDLGLMEEHPGPGDQIPMLGCLCGG
jgi:hypothetical protein